MKYQLILYFFYILLLGCCKPKKEESKPKITIAVAANMQFVIKEIVEAFDKYKNTKCDIVISSSGKLTALIKEGAPYDVFMSADIKYPQEIYNAGFSYNKPKVYAYGKLVLWSVNENIKPSIKVLSNSKINYIALANPETAPYGFASVEVLKNHKIYDFLKDKLIYGESISQTNQFIVLESVDIGFTAMSVVMSQKTKNKGNWIEIDQNDYTPIEQGIIVIKQKNKTNPIAVDFYDFLSSEKAKEILEDYGYSISL